MVHMAHHTAMVTHAVVPDELYDLARLGVLVCLCQPANNNLLVGGLSVLTRDLRNQLRSYMFLACSCEDRRSSARVVWVELDIKELGEV
jgi:hypothetical protein